MQRIKRRSLLQVLSAAIAVPSLLQFWALSSKPALAKVWSRARPGDPAWPSSAGWERLDREVGGRLIKVRSPLSACEDAPSSAACAELFRGLKNPYFLREEAGLTQSLGWVGAWTSRPSAYAVAVRTNGDVVAAVNFAHEHDLRLVVKGGGHSYHGGSNAPDSGNPAGRPRHAKNLKTDLLEELRETLVVREGSRPRRVSKQRALIKSLIAKGIKGDSAAAARLLDLCIRVFGLDDESSAEPVKPLSRDEREVLANAEARLTQLFGLSLPKDRHGRNSRN